eukprot:scaffold93528_cov54-Phaeocystis_antarctica.AAC.2
MLNISANNTPPNFCHSAGAATAPVAWHARTGHPGLLPGGPASVGRRRGAEHPLPARRRGPSGPRAAQESARHRERSARDLPHGGRDQRGAHAAGRAAHGGGGRDLAPRRLVRREQAPHALPPRADRGHLGADPACAGRHPTPLAAAGARRLG